MLAVMISYERFTLLKWEYTVNWCYVSVVENQLYLCAVSRFIPHS
jgi:hypothetical protein